MYWCPHEAHQDMARHIMARYQQQAESLYTDLKDEIGEDNMEVVMATQMCGKEADQKAKGVEDNGVLAICCMLSKYGKCESTDRDSVERQYMNAADHFRTGRPINKVNYLRTLRKDLLRTGVKLKVSQTVEPIIRALQDRHPDFLLGLNGYAKKTEDPDNCMLFMDDLFAQIEVLCKKIENEDTAG